MPSPPLRKRVVLASTISSRARYRLQALIPNEDETLAFWSPERTCRTDECQVALTSSGQDRVPLALSATASTVAMANDSPSPTAGDMRLPTMALPTEESLPTVDTSPTSTAIFVSATAETSTPTESGRSPTPSESRKVTVGDYTNNKPLVLRGLNPSASVYIVLDDDERAITAELHAWFSASTVLSPDSTLTVLVNGIPLSSIPVGAHDGQQRQIIADIPAEALAAEVLEVSFTGYLWTSDDPCRVRDDDASWVTISPQSSIAIESRIETGAPSLRRFPHPFVPDRGDQIPQTLLVVPNVVGDELWVQTLHMALYLGSAAAWHESRLIPVRESEVTIEQASSSHMLLVGRIQDFSLSPQLEHALPISYNVAYGFSTASGPIAPDAGVVMEMQSPYNPRRSLLLVTGTETNGVTRAMTALLHPAFGARAQGSYAIVRSIPDVADLPTSDWKHVTLQNLGYGELVMRGIGRQSRTVSFQVPGQAVIDSATMTLHMSHSDLIRSDMSYLNVYLNGTPVKGVYLDASNAENCSLEFALPVGYLKIGENVLEFASYLEPYAWDCRDLLLDSLWSVVQSDTALTLNTRDRDALLALDQFPVQLSGHTTVVLPDAPQRAEWRAAYAFAMHLGRALGPGYGDIVFAQARNLDAAALDDRHVVLIGRPERNSFLASILDSMPVGLDAFARSANGMTGATSLGLIEIIPSPWSKPGSKVLLVVSGSNDVAVSWALQALSSAEPTDMLRGIAVSVDSALFVRDLATLTKSAPEPGRSAGSRATPPWVRYALVGGLVALLILLGVVIIRRFIRR